MATVTRRTGWRGIAQLFELSRGGAGQNILAMEGLRGVAVILVFGVHYATLVQPWLTGYAWQQTLFKGMHSVGNAGVDLFFVLSGLLIYGHLLRRRQQFFAYFLRRVQRIYPAFLAVFALYVALSLLAPARSKLPPGLDAVPYLIANLLLLPGILPIQPLITVAWSLSYEMLFYLAMPVIVAVFSLRRRSAFYRIALLAGMLLLALVGFALFGGPVRLCMFIFGALLAEALPRTRPLSSSLGIFAGLAGLAVMLVSAPGPGAQALRTAILGLCFGLLCHVALAESSSTLARLLCWNPIRWLGNMSYSYYLVHGLALQILFIVLSRLWVPQDTRGLALAFFMPAFLLSLVPAACLYLMVERPFSLRVSVPLARPPVTGAT